MTHFPGNIDKSWTLFLDRDGVINRRIYGGYVRSPEAFEFLPGVLNSLALLRKYFGKIIVVTNQQGIGKKLMDENQLAAIHRFMLKEITRAGGYIDAVFFCPALESVPGNCRKPAPFMALEAQKRFPEIDFSKSIMAGDSESDMSFGKNAGMFTVLIGHETISPALADFRFPDLPAMTRFIENKIPLK